ncbi:zinc finger BED domain-containing protein 5-like [Clavelina lepadiformis]|uniref:zinc finger BED domain-containing protein 5-like n=1 Tax=Clavelina lepadiformis TaxID=159417 RepID=UPI004042D066
MRKSFMSLPGELKYSAIGSNLPFRLFSIQLDKTTAIASCSQLLVFCRYFTEEDIKAVFFDQERLEWENVCGIYADGAPAILGARSGLQRLVRSCSPDAVSMHCMIHRQALASKTVSESLQDVLNTVIKTILNRLNLKVQRKVTTVLAFLQKLEYWKRKAEKGNFAMFEALSSVIDGNLDINLSSEILAQLINLRKEVLIYFFKITNVDLELVRRPFTIPVEKVIDHLQDELIDLRNDSACKGMFEILSICEFWAKMCVCGPRIGKECVKMKTKARNRLNVEDAMCCAVSSTSNILCTGQ